MIIENNHDISKWVVTVHQTLKLIGFINYVEEILAFLIHKPYNFYNIDDNITKTKFWD